MRPSALYSSPPFVDNRGTHSPALFFGQGTRIRFQIKVGFAWAIFSDEFVKTAVWGNLQELGNKVFGRLKGSK